MFYQVQIQGGGAHPARPPPPILTEKFFSHSFSIYTTFFFFLLDNFEIQSGAHPLSKIPGSAPVYDRFEKNCTVSIILEKSQEVVNKYFKLYDPNHFRKNVRK